MLASTWNSARATVNGLASRTASWSAISRATRSARSRGRSRAAAGTRRRRAGEQPRLALGAAQAPGHASQQPVAGPVPERVVDELEVVEVDQQQRHRAVAPARARHGGAQARLELGAVRQPGQRVEERELAQLGLGAHAVRDVLAREHGHHAALGVGQRGRLPGDPPPRPVARDHARPRSAPRTRSRPPARSSASRAASRSSGGTTSSTQLAPTSSPVGSPSTSRPWRLSSPIVPSA